MVRFLERFRNKSILLRPVSTSVAEQDEKGRTLC